MCQYLAAIGLTADLLAQNLAREGHPRAEAAGEIATLLQDAVDRAREVARGLSPVDRDEGGLESALEELAKSTTRLTGDHLRISSARSRSACRTASARSTFSASRRRPSATPPATAGAQHHHRPGSRATATCRCASATTAPASTRTRAVTGGMGLNIMRYRARVIGGTLEIYPNSPTGTVVACTMQRRSSCRPLAMPHD